MGKGKIMHTETDLGNTGNGVSTIETSTLVDCQAGARTTTGAAKSITQNRGTDELCNLGDIIKYINIHMEVGPRSTIGNVDDRTGWYEYAIVLEKEDFVVMPTTNIGTQNLGVMCLRQYPGDCIWTGQFPIGSAQPNSVDLHLKIPSTHNMLKDGDKWILMTFFRSVSSTSTETAAVRFIHSWSFKAYN